MRQVNALIVDDSITTRKLIMTALTQTGLAEFAYSEASDGVEALAAYQPGETGIVFVDMNMPRMSGLEFIRELRARYEKCPRVVMVTSESSQDRLREAITEPGVDAFMLKPVDRDRLRAGLQKLMCSIPVTAGAHTVPHGECVPQALREIMSKVCRLELSRLEGEAPNGDGRKVLGMTTLHGAVQWSVALGFVQKAAEEVASRLAGSHITMEHPDLGDAIGEITNMVGGRIKCILGSRDLPVTFSLPTVIAASDLQVLLQRTTAVDHVFFHSPAGPIWSVVAVGAEAGLFL